jgi:hypothetical protein
MSFFKETMKNVKIPKLLKIGYSNAELNSIQPITRDTYSLYLNSSACSIKKYCPDGSMVSVCQQCSPSTFKPVNPSAVKANLPYHPNLTNSIYAYKMNPNGSWSQINYSYSLIPSNPLPSQIIKNNNLSSPINTIPSTTVIKTVNSPVTQSQSNIPSKPPKPSLISLIDQYKYYIIGLIVIILIITFLIRKKR